MLSAPVLEKVWPSPDGWRMIKKGEIEGNSWGHSAYVLYEVCTKEEVDQEPYLFVWLHGADGMGTLQTNHMVNMQRKMHRRCFFFVPTSPKPSSDGYRFNWGVRFTKAENRNDWGFIYGEMHAPYLLAFCKQVMATSEQVGAIANIISGYSMGGFGAVQLAAFAPGIFTAAIPVAGYGIGTLESGGMYNAPQPEASHKFTVFANDYAPKLAKVPIFFAVHGVSDKNSSFRDMQELISLIQGEGGDPELVSLDEKASNSDGLKSKTGHGYFNHALLSHLSEGFLYSKLRAALDAAVAKGLGPVKKATAPTPRATVPDAAPKAPEIAAPKAPVKLALSTWTLRPTKPAAKASNEAAKTNGKTDAKKKKKDKKKSSSSSSSSASSSSSSSSSSEAPAEKKQKTG